MIKSTPIIREHVVALLGALLVSTLTSQALAGPELTGTALLTYGAKQFPEDDAIILRWEQHWTLEKDGTVRRRERKWLKLLTRRPIRAYGDPRIDYVEGQDQLVIHRAQATLPDGTVIPVPEYSFNAAAPDQVAGWPKYSSWQQRVVSFSGIENGVVLELDYEVITPPGVLPWIEADLRLQQEFPTLERIVSVTVPSDIALRKRSDPVSTGGRGFQRFVNDEDGSTRTRWSARSIPGARSEPQSVPWQRRCGRLRFTTCAKPADWFSTVIQRVQQAAQPDDAIRKFADAAIEEEANPAERVRKIANKIRESFNFVTSVKALRSLECRPAAEVLERNYGNTLESAALLSAALASQGITGRLMVAIDAERWNPKEDIAPDDQALAGLVLIVDTPSGPLNVHPQQGVIDNPGTWGHHWLVALNDAGELTSQYVYSRGEKKPSTIEIAGKIAVDTEGLATGELRLNLTGGFYDPADLETSDAQKTLIHSLVGQVLSGFDVPEHSVVTLSQERFKASANVKSEAALKDFGDDRLLRLGSGPVFLERISMPLGRSQRRTDVQLAGPFRERLDLTIELPDTWHTSIVPGSFGPIQGDWGRVAQKVTVDGRSVRFVRTISVTKDVLGPSDFDEIRRAVNKLKTDHCLLLAFGK